MPVVLIFQTNDQIVEYPLLTRSVVGRSGTADLKIEDKQMSGKHGAFEVDPRGELIYTDLGSTNGSFLNNCLIQKTTVKINDVIKIGNTFVRIDEKKLNSKEKHVIGQSATKEKQIKLGTLSQQNSIVRGALAIKEDQNNKDKERKSVISKKDFLKKLMLSRNGSAQGKEFEQERSSGQTNMLKLSKGLEKRKSN
jgi:pSer/pThr/pTyr-binding forkhead associated (FHA) protein